MDTNQSEVGNTSGNLAQRQSSIDLDHGEPEKNTAVTVVIETEENNDYLKVKEKPPPGVNASLVILYALFFLMFATGWVNLNTCPLNRLIPIYLIVAGFVGALAKFLSKLGHRCFFNIAMGLIVFDVIWHVCASYWVFKEYQPNFDSTLGLYCNRTAFLFAFWILTLQYTLLAFFIMLAGCYMMMRNDFKKT